MSAAIGAPAPTIPCRLCGAPAARCFEQLVLGRIPAGYFHCAACGLTQAEEPYWLEEAYANPIASADTGLLARNLHLRAVTGTFLELSGLGDRTGLDYAGGWGVFTRLMRDSGYDFRWHDRYAINLFAHGAEWRGETGPPAVCTAFEVLEHFARPREGFAELAALGAGVVITSTEVPPTSPPPADWIYLAPATGQHVAFYERRTLERLGRENGYPFVLAGPFRQVFARQPFPVWRWRAAEHLGRLLFPLLRRRRTSFTLPDSLRLRERR
jgi:hypothetical protein